MKKFLALLATLCLLAGVAVAGGKSEAGKKDAGGTPTMTYKFAHIYQPGHAFGKGVVALSEMVSKKTEGKFTISVHPASQLGSEKDILDGMVNGVIEMAINGPGQVGPRYNPILIFDAPYLFRDVDHAMKVLTSDVGKELWKGCEDKIGLRNIGTLYFGTRYVTSKKPIKTPADMKGFKLRTPDQPLSMAIAKAMGANPTPMALSEVYLALQQGVVDGQENPIPNIYANKFHEVQSYVNLTAHVIQLTPIWINKKKWDAPPRSL